MVKRIGPSSQGHYVEAQRRIAEAAKTNARALDLSRLLLDRLPPQVFQLKSLVELNVRDNRLTLLPPDIGRLTALRGLHLGSIPSYTWNPSQSSPSLPGVDRFIRNRLSSLPREIGQLTALIDLDLDENDLTSLPPEIGQLTALRTLDLSDNRLTALPSEIGRLTSLTKLFLGGNRLRSLPETMGGLRSLKELYLHENEELGLPRQVLGPVPMQALTDTAARPAEILNYYFGMRRNGTQSADGSEGRFSSIRPDETNTDPDVFISHASEDSETFAGPLAGELRSLGYRVWYDRFVLRLGDSLRREVDRGLARCRFGIAVLSPSFFAKHFPQLELDALVARENAAGTKVILPVWHNIDQNYVAKYSPVLADRLAVESSRGLDEVIKAIVAVLGTPGEQKRPK